MSGQRTTCLVCQGSANCPECRTGEKGCPACDGFGICVYCDAIGRVPTEHAVDIKAAYDEQLREEQLRHGKLLRFEKPLRKRTPVRHRQKLAA